MQDKFASASDRRHPTRGADRNQDLVDPEDGLLFPALGDGITLLDIEDGRGVPILQSLVLDHLLAHDGPAFWIDADGHATTTVFARIAPSQRLLDRVHVARGFTAYQHYGAIDDLSGAVTRHACQARTDEDDPSESTHRTPSLVVVPALDAQYRREDTLGDRHAQTLQARTLARLERYANDYDVPVVLTRTTADEFAAPIETAATHHLTCEQTRMGPRIAGDTFETLVYPVEDGAYYQTTFAYWRQILATRARQAGLEPDTPATTDATGIGTGVTADGESTTLTADPLIDAWHTGRR